MRLARQSTYCSCQSSTRAPGARGKTRPAEWKVTHRVMSMEQRADAQRDAHHVRLRHLGVDVHRCDDQNAGQRERRGDIERQLTRTHGFGVACKHVLGNSQLHSEASKSVCSRCALSRRVPV